MRDPGRRVVGVGQVGDRDRRKSGRDLFRAHESMEVAVLAGDALLGGVRMIVELTVRAGVDDVARRKMHPLLDHGRAGEHFGDRIGAALRERRGAFGRFRRGIVHRKQLRARKPPQPVNEAIVILVCRREHGSSTQS